VTAFISPPKRIPFYLRAGLWFAQRIAGVELLPPRLLAWYPKALISSGILEAMIAHDEEGVDARLLKIVRMTVSFVVNCPFCMDMNSNGWEKLITSDELTALQEKRDLADVDSFSERERLAVVYARLVSRTPLSFPAELIAQLRAVFSEREIVILATTAAQVNYWARLIQALGCPPPGLSE